MSIMASLSPLPTEMVIDGVKRVAADRRVYPTYDPASGETLTAVAVSSAADVAEAVDAAARAQKGPWRAMPPAERARCLMRTAAILRRDKDKLAHVESLDSGK